MYLQLVVHYVNKSLLIALLYFLCPVKQISYLIVPLLFQAVLEKNSNLTVLVTISQQNVNNNMNNTTKRLHINNLFIVSAEQIEGGELIMSGIPAGFVMESCPEPFLKDPLAVAGTNATLDEKYCRYGCCIPCPAQNLVSF
jgi:hypothetical protein